MKNLLLELKKFFRLRNVVIALAVLVLLWNVLATSRYHKSAVTQAHTENYPERITVNDYYYSIRILFEEYLLETYGNVITEAQLDDLVNKREALIGQVTAAVAMDEVLQRTQTTFRPDPYGNGVEFTTTLSPEDVELSGEDQLYLWDCTNGQMQFPGTDHPVYFIDGFKEVIELIQEHGVYHVLPRDILLNIRNNQMPIVYFIIAALLLVIPYGVSESRSRTEQLAFSTKAGRKTYLCKVLAAGIGSFIIIGIGVIVVSVMFSQWEVGRYYDSLIDSAMAVFKWTDPYQVPIDLAKQYGSISLLTFYIVMCMAFLLAGTGLTVVAAVVSLAVRNAVTGIAASIPIITAVIVFYDRYLYSQLDYAYDHLAHRWEHCIAAGLVLLLGTMISGVVYLRKKAKNY